MKRALSIAAVGTCSSLRRWNSATAAPTTRAARAVPASTASAARSPARRMRPARDPAPKDIASRSSSVTPARRRQTARIALIA